MVPEGVLGPVSHVCYFRTVRFRFPSKDIDSHSACAPDWVLHGDLFWHCRNILFCWDFGGISPFLIMPFVACSVLSQGLNFMSFILPLFEVSDFVKIVAGIALESPV
jgi:hypothetical protein